MSPAALYLKQAGFDRIGPVKGMRGFEVWHLATAGCEDIAVAIPEAETAEVSWAVRGIFAAGVQQGQANIRAHWLALEQVMKGPTAAIGVAALPDHEPNMQAGKPATLSTPI